MTPEIAPGEALMAVSGIGPAIGQDMARITAPAMLDVFRMPHTLAKLARECVRGEMPVHRCKIRGYDWKHLHEVLSRPLSEEVLHSIQRAFPVEHSELIGEYQTYIQNVHGKLAAELPVTEISSFTGPKFYEPDDLSTFDFYNNLTLLESPLTAYDLICQGAILRQQVEAFQEIYPTLAKAISQSLWDALATETAADEGYRCPIIVEQGLGVWLDRRTVAYDPDHGEPAPEPQPKIRDVKKGPTLTTSNQRATNASS